MEKKNLILYVLMLLIAVIVIAGLVNSFKTSDNLKDALKGINEARTLVDESRIILENQTKAIDSIRMTNANLLGAMTTMESQNKEIKNFMAYRFNRTAIYLDSIKLLIKSKGFKPVPDL
jgi:hypothetical protein